MRSRTTLATAVMAATLMGGGVLAATPAEAVTAPATTTATTAVVRAAGSVATPVTAFTAYGANWRVVVNKGRMSTEGRVVGEHTLRVKRSAFAKGVEFTGRHKRTPITLVIRSGRCVDTAGKNTGMVAKLFVGKRAYRGCAVAGAIQHADT